jgi:hypothetical protein
MAASLVRLKVTLDHVEPVVMRRVVVPWRIRLSRLHEVLQAAMTLDEYPRQRSIGRIRHHQR